MTAQAPAAPFRPCFTRTYRLLARGTNISTETLLATDYLNHFNEVVMLVELLPQAPEFMDDVAAWRPKSYARHFEASGFAHKELAVAAYDQSPPVYREAFDTVIVTLHATLLDGIAALRDAAAAHDAGVLDRDAADLAQAARALIDQASAVINGHSAATRQDEIDALFG
jgi:hypothetical protein